MRLIDCNGCMIGDHRLHQEHLPVGKSDAEVCECEGDCAERRDLRLTQERLAESDNERLQLVRAQEMLEANGFRVAPPVVADIPNQPRKFFYQIIRRKS